MSRNALIAVTIGAIIILGAIAAFLYSQTKPSTDLENIAKMVKEEDNSKNGMSLSTITDLFTQGENQMCTFEGGSEDGVTSGTIYVSGDNARGEFTTTIANDETYKTNMIKNEDTFYMWGDSFPTGMKMVMSVDEWASQIQEESDESEISSSINPNAEVDFKCTSWTVDENLFEAPTDVKFMTIDGMMGLDEDSSDVDSGSLPQISCNLCESMTGDAKNLCLQQCQ